jgi:hypothetical protein
MRPTHLQRRSTEFLAVFLVFALKIVKMGVRTAHLKVYSVGIAEDRCRVAPEIHHLLIEFHLIPDDLRERAARRRHARAQGVPQ